MCLNPRADLILLLFSWLSCDISIKEAFTLPLLTSPLTLHQQDVPLNDKKSERHKYKFKDNIAELLP